MRTLILLCTLAVSAAARMSEESILSNFADRAFRPDSLTLCIVTVQGDTVIFTDLPEADSPEDCCSYRLVSYLPRQDCWVIENTGYEWMDWRLVSGGTGAVDTTISVPVPSPGGERLLCFMEDLTAGFIENGIQIWRVDQDRLTLEFSDLDVPWGPVDAEWADDSTVVFQKMTYDWETMEALTRPGSLELSRDGTWIPDDPADWEW